MRQDIGLPNIGKMLLKRGDFIEDKFGQVQRDLLYEKGQVNEELLCKLFQWYGSYLCWWTAAEEGDHSVDESGQFSSNYAYCIEIYICTCIFPSDTS